MKTSLASVAEEKAAVSMEEIRSQLGCLRLPFSSPLSISTMDTERWEGKKEVPVIQMAENVPEFRM